MTTKTAHRHANGTPPEPPTLSPVEKLQAWLEAEGLMLSVRVLSPVTKETVGLENFVPAGWQIMIQLDQKL